MESVEKLIEHVEAALERGSERDRLMVDYAVEPTPGADRINIVVMGDGFLDLSPGNRHAKVWAWLKPLGDQELNRVASLLILTGEEMGRLQQAPPSSGAILGFGATGGFSFPHQPPR